MGRWGCTATMGGTTMLAGWKLINIDSINSIELTLMLGREACLAKIFINGGSTGDKVKEWRSCFVDRLIEIAGSS